MNDLQLYYIRNSMLYMLLIAYMLATHYYFFNNLIFF
jgi:hypothetical protein